MPRFTVLKVLGLLNLLWCVGWLGYRASIGWPSSVSTNKTGRIYVITVTEPRVWEMGDMARLANTLMHVRNVRWLVVSRSEKADAMRRLLKRTGIKFALMNVGDTASIKTALVRSLKKLKAERLTPNDLVYFANAGAGYDLRLFTLYMPQIEQVGTWAMGLYKGTLIRRPYTLATSGGMAHICVPLGGFAVKAGAEFECAGAHCELCGLRVGRGGVRGLRDAAHPQDVLVWLRRSTMAALTEARAHGYALDRMRVQMSAKWWLARNHSWSANASAVALIPPL